MPGKGGPDAVDKHVGTRLRLRRVELGLSQSDLALRLGGAKENGRGLTFQQVQKYEKGKNRRAASRLYQAATRPQHHTLVFQRLAGYTHGQERDETPAGVTTHSAMCPRSTDH
jgi:transcriptional regulator with XRE-family HTH domain